MRFNSRTRVGATATWISLLAWCCVSIHAPVWVRHLAVEWILANKKFQFTHPCGCDPRYYYPHMNTTVSIHAPVWVRHLLK